MSEEHPAPKTASPIPGVPGPLSFIQVLGAAARLYARKPIQLIAAFLLVYALGLALELVSSPMGGFGAVLTGTLVSIGGTFAMAFSAVILADVVAGRATERGSVSAILRVHAKELLTAGLFAFVIGFLLALLRVLPYISFAIVGPPLVVQIIVLEYRPFGEALRRTGELWRGQSGRVLLYLLGLTLIVLVIFYTLVIYGLPFILPFYSAAILALYLDVRARAEELDLAGFARERELAMAESPVGEPNQG